MGFTDDCYTDGRDPSVTPSALLLPTECIDVTDGISPSAKLYNVVVTNGGGMGIHNIYALMVVAWVSIIYMIWL